MTPSLMTVEIGPLLWAGGAVLVGLVAGVMIGLWWRRETAVTPDDLVLTRSEPVEVPPQLLEVLGVLGQAGMLVGPHDEVVHATTQARALGLCRGDRILEQGVLDAVRRARRDEAPQVFDTDLRRGPGAPVVHLGVRVTTLDENTVLVIADDRTALIRVDETRRDFVANVSHELKTPIGALSLLAETVEGASDDPQAVRHFASRMQIEAARLAELVHQIIDLSRLQSDDPMVRAETVQLGDVVDEALNRTRILARERDVQLVRSGDEDVAVLGDEAKLADAVTNLVQNAIVYSDLNARVAITTEVLGQDDDRMVEISVADNGIGISPADQERVFERFYRADYGRSRANGGTGLGLSIVKHIAAVHGGSVHLWSKPGQGSTFTLRLPVLDEERTCDIERQP